MENTPQKVLLNNVVNIGENYYYKDWVGRGGCWDFSKEIISAQATRDWNKAYCRNKNFKNFIYEVTLRKTGESGPCGLVFQYDDKSDQGYYLLFFPNGGLGVKKFNQEVSTYLTISSSVNLNAGINVWNTIKVICRESTYKISLNGEQLLSLKDDAYSSGKLGLLIHGGPRQTAEFKIISMKELD